MVSSWNDIISQLYLAWEDDPIMDNCTHVIYDQDSKLHIQMTPGGIVWVTDEKKATFLPPSDAREISTLLMWEAHQRGIEAIVLTKEAA